MKKDFLASVVVFLVALPLCMGIAIASGVPIAYGILSGIIGGLVVGIITGSPLQVSGPAAGLVVIVYDIVQTHGMVGLGIATFFAGLVQMISAFLKAGPYFRAVSPSVIRGMLSGIGVLILSSQFHVMLDDKPSSSAIQNILTVPKAITKIFDTSLGIPHMEAAFLGVVAILLILVWNNLKEKYKLVVPGALVGIVAVTLIAYYAKLPINKVTLSGSFSDVFSANMIFSNLGKFNWDLLLLSIPLALVATAETLLCTNAVEKLRPSVPVDYNKELLAQGVGNTLCGVFSALPLTGVIVRSAANVEAGGETNKSTILHGVWLLLFVCFLGSVLELIPTSSLAAILVLTGYKLINLKEMIKAFKVDKQEFAIWILTTCAIVGTDLLKGIFFGLALSLFKLLYDIHLIEISKDETNPDKTILSFQGKASFLTLPKISKVIDLHSKSSKELELNLRKLIYTDDAVEEYLANLKDVLGHRGVKVSILYN